MRQRWGESRSHTGPPRLAGGTIRSHWDLRYPQYSKRTLSETYEADLFLGPGGHMHLESTAGICREPDPVEVQVQLARGVRTFTCGNVSYVLRTAGSTLRGEITVPYTVTYAGGKRQDTARAHLRVQRKG